MKATTTKTLSKFFSGNGFEVGQGTTAYELEVFAPTNKVRRTVKRSGGHTTQSVKRVTSDGRKKLKQFSVHIPEGTLLFSAHGKSTLVALAAQ
jgi:hypothetical protein